MKLSTLIFAMTAVLLSHNGFAIGDAAKPLQQQWAIAKYQTDKTERAKAFEALAKQAREIERQQPDNAEVLVWVAIILSTYAGEKGGPGALGLVKDAKALLEKAEAIDPNVLNGSIYTSLGSLYYQVPGWPLSFGDYDKARAYLEKSLLIDPDGIDSNYFYGDFMLRDGKYQQAANVLKKALAAAPRPGRPIADAGRKEEIRAALAEAAAHLP